MSFREWRFRIEDIIDSIFRIERYTKDITFQEFSSNEMILDAVIRNFIIIGEAARNIPQEITQSYPDIPWRLMGDLRNFVAHTYWGINLQTIWDTIQNDLPPLVPQLQAILKAEGDRPAN
ncbi:MAG: DUF86 domain-containing protein [Candidatus Sumerlaeota bacterium]|nr:DUF86 domain-containing protein [Candidatus Sumerlaeota bacterium]